MRDIYCPLCCVFTFYYVFCYNHNVWTWSEVKRALHSFTFPHCFLIWKLLFFSEKTGWKKYYQLISNLVLVYKITIHCMYNIVYWYGTDDWLWQFTSYTLHTSNSVSHCPQTHCSSSRYVSVQRCSLYQRDIIVYDIMTVDYFLIFCTFFFLVNSSLPSSLRNWPRRQRRTLRRSRPRSRRWASPSHWGIVAAEQYAIHSLPSLFSIFISAGISLIKAKCQKLIWKGQT